MRTHQEAGATARKGWNSALCARKEEANARPALMGRLDMDAGRNAPVRAHLKLKMEFRQVAQAMLQGSY